MIKRLLDHLNKKGVTAKKILMQDAMLGAILIAVLFCLSAPAPINGLSVTDSGYDHVSLEWTAQQQASSYNIYRSEDGENYSFVGISIDNEYRDNSIHAGRKYYYKVTAYHGFRRGGDNDPVTASTELSIPDLEGSDDTGEVVLSYEPVDGASGYEILRDGEAIAEETGTEFTDLTAEADTEYTYAVRAFIDEEEDEERVYSDPSNELEMTMISAGTLRAEIRGEQLIFRWDTNEKYSNCELYENGVLVETDGSEEFVVEGFADGDTYEMKLVGFSDDGSIRSPDKTQTFAITAEEMDNQAAIDAACDWGVSIAGDNRFQYGTGARAHRYGCYFCGTNTGPNLYKKGTSLVDGHSYEMTYCCNPFVHACFAHGAGDPTMLAACQAGSGISMSVGSFTRYGNWKYLGKPSQSNLHRGDVLVSDDGWAHVALYIGNGQIVHAIDKGWTDESIKVANLGSNYSKYNFVMRYTGNGRGTRYIVQEVEDEPADAPADITADDTPEGGDA